MYGYKIEDGEIKIVPEEASIIQQVFSNYLSGMSLRKSAQSAGIKLVHSTVKKIIKDQRYIGDNYYPAIVEKDIFARANGELLRRASKFERQKRRKAPPIYSEFVMQVPEKQFDEPIKQAEYLYSLIEVIE